MNLKEELLKENSKTQRVQIADSVVENITSLDELVAYFLDSENYRLAQRAANTLNLVVERDISLVRPYLGKIISNLENEVHDAVKRNTVRILQFIDIPDEYLGDVADKCFRYLDSEKEPIAVRAFSMTVLYNIVCKVPELKDELIVVIEDHLPYGSAGFKARAKHILKKLQKSRSAIGKDANNF